MYLNKAFIFGNITKDPEIKALPSGIKVASFSLATNRVYKDKDGNKKENVEFHNVVVFGKQAETIGQYMKKGSSILVEGRIQTRSWEGKDGEKKYRTEIIVENFQFGPKTGGGSGSASSANYGEKQSSSSASSSAKKENEGVAIQYPEEEINIEDIPF